MRDQGLRLAIDAAGGIGALARGLGIRQPSVSGWDRVPAERVLAVEGMTGIRRELLRPDLFGASDDVAAEGPSAPSAIDDIELARAAHYLLLARLLRAAPTPAFLAELARLGGDGSPLGLARIDLAEAAGRIDAADAGNEYFALFVGVGRGEILPYASFYRTGFLHERPLAELRRDLDRLGIERSAGNFDPEDHLGLLLEMMGGFANGTFAADLAEQTKFFERHIASWGARAFDDIAAAPSARFYKAVGRLGRQFLDVEAAAFEIEAEIGMNRATAVSERDPGRIGA